MGSIQGFTISAIHTSRSRFEQDRIYQMFKYGTVESFGVVERVVESLLFIFQLGRCQGKNMLYVLALVRNIYNPF